MSLLRTRQFLTKIKTDILRNQIRLYCIQNRQAKKPSKFPGFLLCALVFSSSFGYTFFKSKDYTSTLHNVYNFLLPKFSGLSFNIFDISRNRSKYNFIADVVEICAPAVVLVQVKDSKATKRTSIFANGSGFIIGEDGLILTNAHVVMIVMRKPNLLVTVRLMDGSTHDAVVEDIDLEADLATLRINKKNLPVIKLGNSKNLRPGEFVVAIGSPLSLSNSITSSVVSSPNRRSEELGISHNRMSYIQTDAAITFGNSGGPLVNLEGEVIGINAMKITPGISFAIPIDYAREFLKKSDAKRRGKVVPIQEFRNEELGFIRRRYLGITMLTLIPELIFDMQHIVGNGFQQIKHGVLIWRIMEGSSADLGGLKNGDIITYVNGKAVTSAAIIFEALDHTGPLLLTIVRNGEVLQLSIEPENLE